MAKLGAESRARPRGHPWPGNVREHENVREQSLVLLPYDPGVLALPLDDPSARRPGPGRLASFAAQSRSITEEALRTSEGRVYGAGGAAQLLGLKPTTLVSKMDRLGARLPKKLRATLG